MDEWDDPHRRRRWERERQKRRFPGLAPERKEEASEEVPKQSGVFLDDSFYKGFEGEASICLFTEDRNCSLKIWNGYFETLLDAMLDQNIAHRGMLENYCLQTGWYDEDPWELVDLKLAVTQFQQMDFKPMQQERRSELLSELPQVAEKIIAFLEEAMLKNQKVYMSYD